MSAPAKLTAKKRVTSAAFLFCLATVLYFALVPMPQGGRLRELPRSLADWLNTHDDLANFAVFGVLSLLAMAVPQGIAGEGRFAKIRTALSPTKTRLMGLLGLVMILELAQRCIPGRVSDWHDVATGAAGVVVARLIQRVWTAGVSRKTKVLG